MMLAALSCEGSSNCKSARKDRPELEAVFPSPEKRPAEEGGGGCGFMNDKNVIKGLLVSSGTADDEEVDSLVESSSLTLRSLTSS